MEQNILLSPGDTIVVSRETSITILDAESRMLRDVAVCRCARMSKPERAIIIGAGPAGLTAAYELLTRAGIQPIVLEKSEDMGGLSKTVDYKGNRIDIGGHRFFSKSDRVMKWWLAMMPLAERRRGQRHPVSRHADARARQRRWKLRRSRRTPTSSCCCATASRASTSCGSLFEYPIRLSKTTLIKLGLLRTVRIGISYMKSAMFPLKQENTLEEFFDQPFRPRAVPHVLQVLHGEGLGRAVQPDRRRLGRAAHQGPVAIQDAAARAARRFLTPPAQGRHRAEGDGNLAHREVSLPQVRPGADVGGNGLQGPQDGRRDSARRSVWTAWSSERQPGPRDPGRRTLTAGETKLFEGDYFFSTMPVKELIRGMEPAPPANVREVAEGLIYRDFITVGLLVSRLKLKEHSSNGRSS